jgi:glucose/arabinose dehydrogenase/PKD repeat protein
MLVVLTLLSTASARAALPAGFTDSLVAAVPTPTALAFTDDGRMLVTSQSGTLHVVQDGSVTPALDLGSLACTDSERGLLGVAIDPAFSSNRFIYLYYTAAKSSGCANRVSRFVLEPNNVVDPASETILLDNIPSPAGNHNGGDLHFGKDGYLYVSVGDGGCDYNADSGCGENNDAARDLNVLVGKILRITSNGGIPSDNPFLGSNSARCGLTGHTDPGKVCQETFAWGLRNPFRIAFDPNSDGTHFNINDVGQNLWEEIDVGQAGADFGWNVREGFCAANSTTDCGPAPAGMTNPIFAYGHADGCDAITGGAFVPNGVWPNAYNDSYLFSDYLCGKIWQLVPTGASYAATEFATDLGSGGPITMMFGPSGTSQALYYTTYANGGQVRIIEFSAPQNHTPTAAITADVTSGTLPLTVHLNGSGSSDPDPGDTLTYLWNFGDGSGPLETTIATTTHQYTAAGSYTVSLTVRDDHGAASAPVTLEITVAAPQNHTPTAAITADVTAGTVPFTVHFDGTGSSDPDPGDSLTYVWDFGDGSAPAEGTSATVMHQYLVAGVFEATLTVRDSAGLTSAPATLRVDVSPLLVLPENDAAPEINGVTRVGNLLVTSEGSWTGSVPLYFSYQWVRCDADGEQCVPIAKATDSTYLLAPLDFGATLRVVVTATNAAGSAIATSTPTPRIKHACSGTPCTG